MGGDVPTRSFPIDYVRYDDERFFEYAINPPIE
jgi:hypothetical protein